MDSFQIDVLYNGETFFLKAKAFQFEEHNMGYIVSGPRLAMAITVAPDPAHMEADFIKWQLIAGGPLDQPLVQAIGEAIEMADDYV